MGGLQNGLIGRGKAALGDAVIEMPYIDNSVYQELKAFLKRRDVFGVGEMEQEVLVRTGGRMSPMILHGVMTKEIGKGHLQFLKRDNLQAGLVVATDLASKLGLRFYQRIQVISPSTMDALLGDLPRFLSIEVSDLVMTRVPEVDSLHAWTRASFLQNLIRKRGLNRIRLWGKDIDWSVLADDLKRKFGSEFRLLTWQEQNKSLVWALGLETKVMLFLFLAMTLLVALSILAGLLLFFERVRNDLISFWILGTGIKSIENKMKVFLLVCNTLITSSGILAGVGFLLLLEKYGANIMPAIFVERGIPILITSKAVLIAFVIPFIVFALFSRFALMRFRKDNNDGNFLNVIRSTG